MAEKIYNWGGGTNYSTDEQVVGQWIDGKPLYQKTLPVTAPTNITTDYSWTSLGLSDIDTIFLINGSMLTTLGWYFTTPFWASTNDYFIMTAFTEVLRICSPSWSYCKSGFVTVQYTKTTD